MAEKRKLFIYEALELRSEYDARIKTSKDTLPYQSGKASNHKAKQLKSQHSYSITAPWLRVSTFTVIRCCKRIHFA